MSILDDLDKQAEEESKNNSGGGGVICQFRFEAGYKIFAKGLGNRESFFAYTPGDEASQKAALLAAKACGEKYGVTKAPSTAAQIVLRKNSVEAREVGWKDDRYFVYPVWTPAYKEVLKPSLAAAGVNAIGDYWGKIGFKADPSGKKYTGRDGKEHDDLTAYVAQLFESENAAIVAASAAQAGGADTGAPVSASIPPGYTAESWAKQEGDIRKMRLIYLQKGVPADEATAKAAADYGATAEQVAALLSLSTEIPF